MQNNETNLVQLAKKFGTHRTTLATAIRLIDDFPAPIRCLGNGQRTGKIYSMRAVNKWAKNKDVLIIIKAAYAQYHYQRRHPQPQAAPENHMVNFITGKYQPATKPKR